MRQRISGFSISKNDLLIYLLTFFYNISNISLYIESPNEFPGHYGLIDPPGPLSQGDRAEIIAFWVIVATAVGLLFPNNQKSYSQHIRRPLPFEIPQKCHALLPPSWGECLPTDTQQCSTVASPLWKRAAAFLYSFLGAVYKSAVSACSLAVLLKSQWSWNDDNIIYVALSVGIGNIAAQLAIFRKDTLFHIPNSYYARSIFVHLLTVLYNVPNAILYFNQGDAFLSNIGWSDHRISEGNAGWELILWAALIIGTVSLSLSTQRAYYHRVARCFTDPEAAAQEAAHACGGVNIDPLLETAYDQCLPFFQVESYVSSVYKALINFVSLVAASYAVGLPLGVGFGVATVCAFGNWVAMYAILKPEPSQRQLVEAKKWPERTSTVTYCFGLFGKTIKRPDTLSLRRVENPSPQETYALLTGA